MFELPPLPYDHAALEPVISRATMRLHHGKHHKKYVETLNELLADATPRSLEEVVREAFADDEKRKLFNNAAQAWNHGFFWACMTPTLARPRGDLENAILETFGSVENLKAAFVTEAVNHFASGWAWLVVKAGQLEVVSTHDAETVLTQADVTPLLVCDLWEHAYYLDHQNNRAAFLAGWWDCLVNWAFAESQYGAAQNTTEGWRYPSAEILAHDKSRVG